MNYRETLQYMYDALPMFHRQGKTAYKKDLTNIRALCDALDNPQQKLKCIHIAGTNGKGSVSHMMAAILQAHGYKTGLYVSPHYKDFRERIKINGRYISRNYITRFVEKNMDLFNKVAPSFFEMTVAMAFSYFKKQKVDFAVIETGLGGRLDSTNIIQPLLSIITNISWDHSDLLGDSLEKIAQEKAGIIKADIPVVIGRKQIESEPVFNNIAKAQHAPIYYAQDHTTIQSKEGPKGLDRISFEIDGKEMVVKPSLNGIYQLENINTVFSACQVLNASKIVQLESNKIAIGIEKTSELTCMIGRWQQIASEPDVFVDSAHNEDGIKYLIRQIEGIHFNKLHFICGFVKDKPIDKVLVQLPKDASYYFVKASIPRALDEQELQQQAKAYGLTGSCFSKPKQALRAARKHAGKEDLIVVSGSIFVVGEFL